MSHLAVRVDALTAQLGDGAPQAAFRLRMVAPGRIALRRDDQEARRASPCPLADSVEQRLPDDGLVCEHEDVLVPRLRGQVDYDVLDGDAARALADAIDDVPPEPARLLLRDGWRG